MFISRLGSKVYASVLFHGYKRYSFLGRFQPQGAKKRIEGMWLNRDISFISASEDVGSHSSVGAPISEDRLLVTHLIRQFFCAPLSEDISIDFLCYSNSSSSISSSLGYDNDMGSLWNWICSIAMTIDDWCLWAMSVGSSNCELTYVTHLHCIQLR